MPRVSTRRASRAAPGTNYSSIISNSFVTVRQFRAVLVVLSFESK
jgi:hypothetical protein